LVKGDISEGNDGGSEGTSKTPFSSGSIGGIEITQGGKVSTSASFNEFSLGVGGVVSIAVQVAWFVVTELLLKTREEIVKGVGVHGDGGVLGKVLVSDVESEEIFNLEVI